MTKDNWERVQSLLEDIDASVDAIIDEYGADAELRNIKTYTSTLYGVCESDYCDDSTDELPHGYEEIWPMFPDGNMLSVGDMNRLKEHIEAWKRGE